MRINLDLLRKCEKQISNSKGWEIVLLEDVLKLITYGLTVRPKYHSQGVPLISATQIRNGIVELNSAPRIAIDDYEKLSEKCKARSGDILFAKTGTIGHCALCHSNEKVALAQNVARLVFDEAQIDVLYALHYLRSPFIQDLAKRSAKGNAVQDLQLGEIKKFPIPVPPIAEQRRIAAILDRADAVRRKRQEAIALTEELLRSAFLAMLGNPFTNSKGWHMSHFDKVGIQIIDGDRGKAYPSAEQLYDNGFCLFLNTKNVTKLGFDFTSCSFISKEKDLQLRKGKLQRGDVVLTTRGTLGNVAFYDLTVPYENIRINSGMVVFRADKRFFNSQFLYYLLRSQFFEVQVQKASSGSAQPQLPIRTISSFQIPVPRLDEQEKFATKLSSVEEQRKQYLENLLIAENFFNSLLQRAFRGEL